MVFTYFLNDFEMVPVAPIITGYYYYYYYYYYYVGRDSSVGIATGYGLDGPGIKARWGRDFSHTSRPAMGPTQPPVQCVPALPRR
jgi:hypothetical protein